MDNMPLLSTPRLTLTPLTLADAPAIQRLFAHWDVVRYLDHRVPGPTRTTGR